MCYPFAQRFEPTVHFLLPKQREGMEMPFYISGRRSHLIPDEVQEVPGEERASALVAHHVAVPPTFARATRRGGRRR